MAFLMVILVFKCGSYLDKSFPSPKGKIEIAAHPLCRLP